MKQLFLGVLVVLGLVGQATPVSAVDVDNFKIENYDIHYELRRDNDGHSYLTTTETIRALFPYFDQNHGIERAIPNSYQGHSTNLRIESVKNIVGDSWNYTTYENNGNTVLRIGDAERYVYGKNTYTIRYTQKDVTRYFDNTNADEFLLGYEWN